MGIFSRKPSAPAPASDSGGTSDTAAIAKSAAKPRPAARPRVRLTPDELKQTHRFSPKEKLIGYGLAAVEAIILTIVTLDNGLSVKERTGLLITLIGLALFGVCVRFTNRLGATMGGMGAVLLWNVNNGGPKDVAFGLQKVTFIFPLIGFVLYLTFASARAKQRLTTERIRSGNLTNPPQAKKQKVDVATSDSQGRALAAKSKRYTPPKTHKKK
jgi:hypothetical protein